MSSKMDFCDKSIVLERELQNLKLKNNMIQEFSENLKKQLQDSEESLQKSRHEYYEVLQNHDKLKFDFDKVKDEMKKLNDEKMEIFQLLKIKNDEITDLKNSLQEIRRKNSTEFESSKNSSLNDIKIKEIELQFIENRLKSEKELYQNQIQILNNELENKNNEVINLRKENSEKVLEANIRIEQQSTEICNLKFEITRLEKLNQSKDVKCQELSKNFSDLQVYSKKLESTFNSESEGKDDIINLLMTNKQELEQEMVAKDQNIEELRQLVKQGYEAHNQLEEKFESMKQSYIKDVKELEDERNKLVEELELSKINLKDFHSSLIEKQFEQNFPFILETNRKMSSSINLSDFYDELVKTKRELVKVNNAKIELESQLEELKEQINLEKPVFYKNIQEYDLIVENYQKLEQNLELLLSEKDKFISEKDEDTRMINTLKREIQRYELENNDLSVQVTCLLKSVQEANGFKIFDDSSSQVSSSNEVVTFKDIKDLQEKNRKLLSLLHELNNELKKKESINKNETIVQLEKDIETLNKTNETLKADLVQKNQIIESNQKRRNNYFDQSNVSDDYDWQNVLVENKNSQAKIEKLMNEIEKIRQKSLDDVRRLENDRNKLVCDNALLTATQNRLDSELESKNQLLEELNLTLEKFQNENVSLRDRNIKLNRDLENVERNVILLKDQLEKLGETIKLKDTNLDFLKAQLNDFKNNSELLIKENARLDNEFKMQCQIIDSLKQTHEKCKLMENETIINQKNQIDNLQKEVFYYREKTEKQEQKWKTTMDDFANRLHHLQVMLDKERNAHLQLQQQNFELKIEFQKNQHHSQPTMEEKAHASESSQSQTIFKNTQMAQDEIRILKGKLNNAEEQCENLKSLNKTLEENFNKLMNNNSDIKITLDQELKLKLEVIDKLNQTLENLNKEHSDMVMKKDQEINQLKTLVESSENRSKQLKVELDEAKEVIEKVYESEHQVLDDLKIQSILAAKAQQDYENQVELRNKDAKTLFDLQLNLENLQSRFADSEQKALKAAEDLRINTELFENERKVFEEQTEKFKLRCSQLEQVNDSLITQIEQLNNQIIALQNNSDLFLLDENQQKENSNQMFLVIKFLREEKNRFQLRVSELSEIDDCLRIEIENYKQEIQNLQKALQMEKESVDRIQNMNEFNEIIAKAQIVPILNENNARLQMHVSQLEKECKELMEKVKSIELKEKSLQVLAEKAVDDSCENEFLKSEVETWKAKANTLAQQLKNFDTESVKRLLNEKSNLNKQVQSQTSELNKFKLELETKVRALLSAEQETTSLRQRLKQLTDENKKATEDLSKVHKETSSLQSVNAQLRLLARKYKDRAEGKTATDKEMFDKEVQCEAADESSQQQEAQKLLEETNHELLSKIDSLNQDVVRLNEVNAQLKRHGFEKEESAKKMASIAKQRISDLNVKRKELTKENLDLKTTLEELQNQLKIVNEEKQQKITESRTSMDHSAVSATSDSVKLTSTASILSSKAPTLIQTASSTAKPSLSSSEDSLGTSVATSTTTASCRSAFNPVPLVRHTVMPQIQEQSIPSTAVGSSSVLGSRNTPRASIKPLNVAPTGFPVVPQVTVQPTLTTLSTNNQQNASTSVSSTSTSSHHHHPPSSASTIEISEASTSQQASTSLSQAPQSFFGFIQPQKRTYEHFDEPTSSNSKKPKILERIQHQQQETFSIDQDGNDDENSLIEADDNKSTKIRQETSSTATTTSFDRSNEVTDGETEEKVLEQSQIFEEDDEEYQEQQDQEFSSDGDEEEEQDVEDEDDDEDEEDEFEEEMVDNQEGNNSEEVIFIDDDDDNDQGEGMNDEDTNDDDLLEGLEDEEDEEEQMESDDDEASSANQGNAEQPIEVISIGDSEDDQDENQRKDRSLPVSSKESVYNSSIATIAADVASTTTTIQEVDSESQIERGQQQVSGTQQMNIVAKKSLETQEPATSSQAATSSSIASSNTTELASSSTMVMTQPRVQRKPVVWSEEPSGSTTSSGRPPSIMSLHHSQQHISPQNLAFQQPSGTIVRHLGPQPGQPGPSGLVARGQPNIRRPMNRGQLMRGRGINRNRRQFGKY